MRRHLLSLFATLLLPLQVAATTIDLSVVNGDTRIVGADANGFVGLTVRAGDVTQAEEWPWCELYPDW